MPKVSIVLTTFNRCHLLKQAIESVFRQTFQDWELIIMDDGSTDETKQVIEAYAHDSRIRYVFHSNQGISFSRAKGTQLATSPYVAFLDDDDVYHPKKLEFQVDYLEKNQMVGLVYSYVHMLDQNDQFLMRWPVRPAQTFMELLHDNTIPTNAGLIRKECFERLGTFRSDFKGSDDYEMWLRIAKNDRIDFLPMMAGIYRVHGQSMSNNKRKRCSNDVLVFQTVMQYGLSRVERKKVFQRVIELTYTKGSDALTSKNYSDAIFYFSQALRFSMVIGLHISWGRYSNLSYQLLRPYAALATAIVLFLKSSFLKGQSSNV